MASHLRVSLAVAVCALMTVTAAAQPSTGDATDGSPPPAPGFLDFNSYYDSRASTVTTLNILANLPRGFQYFSLTNYFSANDGTELADLESFYTEQNVRYAPVDGLPLDATAQWVVRSPSQNDALRLGARWRLSDTPVVARILRRLHLSYSANFHVYQFDFVSQPGYRWQIEHVYRMSVLPHWLDERVYVGGFIDHNLWTNSTERPYTNRLVTEHQLGVRVADNLHLVTEYRLNEYLDHSRHGLGFGVQYVMPFTYADANQR